MCLHKLHLVTVRMSADLALPLRTQPVPSERVVFLLYQLATWVTFSALDDAAMMAFALS
jgi:hypothetical protein